MGVYVDISFQAKLTDFGYEIVQEIYRNRNKSKLPVVEFYQKEEYDDEGNLLQSSHAELEKICNKYNWPAFLTIYSNINLHTSIMFGCHSSLKDNESNSILTENKEWIFCTVFKCSGGAWDDGLEELLQYIISEPVIYEHYNSECDKPFIKTIYPVDINSWKNISIFEGRVVQNIENNLDYGIINGKVVKI